MYIESYYFNKKEREQKTKLLEKHLHKICDIVFDINSKDNRKLEVDYHVEKLVSKKFNPKFLDDTKFVVVSRYHALITAVNVAIERELVSPKNKKALIKFLKYYYIPFCQSLQKNLLHRFSNHGSLGLMGEIIASAFIARHDNSHLIEKKYKRNRLNELSRELNSRCAYSILEKDCFLGKRGEFWIENLRNTKGLYYTYLNLSALLRSVLCLRNSNISINKNCIEKLDMAFDKYYFYYKNPEIWPYTNKTKIPVLRQLQELLLPSGGEFIYPRKEGKEGSFVVGTSMIFPRKETHGFLSSYKVISTFPHSPFFVKNQKFHHLL